MRRKFFGAQKFAPACKEALELIGELYAIEADLPGWYALQGEERQAALAHRLAVRQQKSAPLTQRIRDWAHAQRAMPGSAFRKAIEYMETARLRGEDPGHYLRRAALAAIENPGTVTLPKAQS